MSKEKKQKELKWYDSGHTITSLIIAVIFIIIVCSQSLAAGEVSLALFSSVINHNSIYLLVLIYFILLKFSVGKRYFNYLNVFLVFVYFIATITSLLTVVQSFSLNTILNFTMNFILVIYLSHTLFRDSHIWKEFHFSKSPFNELTNEWFYYAVVVIGVFLLAVNLISTAVIGGVIIAILDTIYYVLFGRYLYLYREYLDAKKLDINNEGNFDEVREKVQVVLDKTDIDEKIVEGVKEVKEKVDTFVAENEIDKKLEAVKDKIVDTSNEVKDTVGKMLEEKSDSHPKEKKKKTTRTKKTTKKKEEQ